MYKEFLISLQQKKRERESGTNLLHYKLITGDVKSFLLKTSSGCSRGMLSFIIPSFIKMIRGGRLSWHKGWKQFARVIDERDLMVQLGNQVEIKAILIPICCFLTQCVPGTKRIGSNLGAILFSITLWWNSYLLFERSMRDWFK